MHRSGKNEISLLPPTLFALYQVLSLLENNTEELPMWVATRAFILSVVFGVGATILLGIIIKSWEKAALIITPAIFIFFSLDDIFTIVKNIQVFGFVIGRFRYLIVILGVALGFWLWWIFRRLKDPGQWIKFFTLIGIFSILFPAFSIIKHEWDLKSFGEQEKLVSLPEFPATDPQLFPIPDIYYIILDGYGRKDVLQGVYGFDNSELIQFLENSGFYVGGQSTSNYNTTGSSLASSLNMEYINTLTDLTSSDSKDNRPLFRLAEKSRLRGFLKSNGYRFVAFETSHPMMNMESADIYLSSAGSTVIRNMTTPALNPFESLLIEGSAIPALVTLGILPEDLFRRTMFDPAFQAHRDRINFAFSTMPDFSKKEGNFFVFAHIIAPHPPFVFDRDGEPVQNDYSFRLSDGNHYPGKRKEYIERYVDQLKYINKRLIDTIQEIQSNPDNHAIIVIQGDHGPGAYLVWESLNQSNVKERFSILNAYFFPGGDYKDLYPSITPVNSFRVILNQFFNTRYVLLPDENFFSNIDDPYQYSKVSSQVKQ